MSMFLISLIISTLSGMGVGGGGLLVIYLTLIQNVEQLISQGANLCFFVATAIASTIYNSLKKKIYWKTTFVLSTVGIIFSIFGVWIAGKINPYFLRKIFGIMLIISGSFSLISAFSKKKQNKSI